MRTEEEKEICKIHNRNQDLFFNTLKKIRTALKVAVAKRNCPTNIIVLDDKEEPNEIAPENTKARDFLEHIINSYNTFKAEKGFLDCFADGQCLNDTAIHFYLSRVLQPLSDSTEQGICYLTHDICDFLSRNESIERIADLILKRYQLQYIQKFVLILNTPGHFITTIVSIGEFCDQPTIMCMDSLSRNTITDSSALRILDRIAMTFGMIYSRDLSWNFINPLQEKLQSNGVDCGVWSILFSETLLHNILKLEDLKSVNIPKERNRILKSCKELLKWGHYLKSYQEEGVIYVNPNPESTRIRGRPTDISSVCEVERMNLISTGEQLYD